MARPAQPRGRPDAAPAIEVIAVFVSPREAALALLTVRAVLGTGREWLLHGGLGEGFEGPTILLSGTCRPELRDRIEQIVMQFGGMLLTSSRVA